MAPRFLLTLLLLAALPGGCFANLEAEGREEAPGFRDDLRSTTRYKLFSNNGELDESFKRFCAWPENQTGYGLAECDLPVYAEGVLWPMFVGVICATVVICCCGPCVWLWRCCCCGGYNPSHGFCCPGERFDFAAGEGYSLQEMTIVRAIAVVLACIAIVFTVAGVTGASLTSAVIPEIKDTIQTMSDDIIEDVKIIDETIANSRLMRRFLGNESLGEDLIAAVENLGEEFEPVYQQIIEVDQGRTAAMIIMLIIAGSTFVFLGLGALLGFKKFAWPVAMCPGSCCGCCMWLLFGLHFPTAVFFADFCTEMDNSILNNGTSGNEFDIAHQIVDCKNSDLFVNLRRSVDQAIEDAVNSGCTGVESLCNATYPCPLNPATQCQLADCTSGSGLPNSTDCNLDTITSFTQATISEVLLGCPTAYNIGTGVPTVPPANCPTAIDASCNSVAGLSDPVQKFTCGLQPITIRECAEDPDRCAFVPQKEFTTLIVDGLDAVKAFQKLYEDVLIDFLNCEQPPQLFLGVTNAICVTMLTGLYLAALACGVFGALFCVGIPVAFLGIKRFRYRNRRALILGGEDLDPDYIEELRQPPKYAAVARKPFKRAFSSTRDFFTTSFRQNKIAPAEGAEDDSSDFELTENKWDTDEYEVDDNHEGEDDTHEGEDDTHEGEDDTMTGDTHEGVSLEDDDTQKRRY